MSSSAQGSSSQPDADPKSRALSAYRRRLLEHRELDAKLKESESRASMETNALCWRGTLVRLGLRSLEKEYDKSEDDIKALQSVGQVIGEVLKQLDDERCKRKRSKQHR